MSVKGVPSGNRLLRLEHHDPWITPHVQRRLNYTVTVTGASGAIQHTTKVTVTVQ